MCARQGFSATDLKQRGNQVSSEKRLGETQAALSSLISHERDQTPAEADTPRSPGLVGLRSNTQLLGFHTCRVLPTRPAVSAVHSGHCPAGEAGA